MKPGRELDALVAEKVMGTDLTQACGLKTGEQPDSAAGWFCYECPEVGSWGDPTSHTRQPKHYSTDIAAAWEVVEKLKTIPGMPKEWGDSYDDPFPIALTFKCGGWAVEWSPTYWISEFRAEAETAPLAICLAALKTVGFDI